jgi:hypothetical protein
MGAPLEYGEDEQQKKGTSIMIISGYQNGCNNNFHLNDIFSEVTEKDKEAFNATLYTANIKCFTTINYTCVTSRNRMF